MKTHRDIELRSIALHAAIAEKIAADPELINVARNNLARWMQSQEASTAYFIQWQNLLDKPIPELLNLLTSDNEQMCCLRQSSPFCGILSPKERWKIYETYRS